MPTHRSTHTFAHTFSYDLSKNGLHYRHARHNLLGDDANNGNHGHAAVVELLGAHGDEGVVVVGAEAEGVVLQVARHVVVAHAGDFCFGV